MGNNRLYLKRLVVAAVILLMVSRFNVLVLLQGTGQGHYSSMYSVHAESQHGKYSDDTIKKAKLSEARLKDFLKKYGYREVSYCHRNVWLVTVYAPPLGSSPLTKGMKDTDGDGLLDSEEKSLGTNPNKIDSDGDCIPDGVEAGYASVYATDKLKVLGEGEYILIIYRNINDPAQSSIYLPLKISSALQPGYVSKTWKTIVPLKAILNPLDPDTDKDGIKDNVELATIDNWDAYMGVYYFSAIAGLYGSSANMNFYMLYNQSNYETDVFDPLFYCLPTDTLIGSNPLGLSCLHMTGHMSSYDKYIQQPTQHQTELRRAGGAYEDKFFALGLDPHDILVFVYSSPVDPDTDHDGLKDGEEAKIPTIPSLDDSDHDGLTDYLEVKTYGTSPMQKDTDEDGLSDYDEILTYHTDPLKKDTDGDGLTDNEEIMYYHTDPLNPDTDGDGLDDKTEEYNSVFDPLKTDTDGDGLNDFLEAKVYNTRADWPDTDKDGLSDYDEVVKYHTNPLSYDTDGDGLTDYDEITKYHTDPNMADTDHDGLSDNNELSFHTDPLMADTDGDGLTDGEEVNGIKAVCVIHDYINNENKQLIYSFNSDPTKADTDNDGLSDYQEYQICTNPYFKDTDGDGLSDKVDPYPYSQDADGDGLSDKDELAKGTSPFNPDTDGDGVSDAYDSTLDTSNVNTQPPEPVVKKKSIKGHYELEPLESDGLVCKAVSHFDLKCTGSLNEIKPGTNITLSFKSKYVKGKDVYVPKRIEHVSNILHGGGFGESAAKVENGKVMVTYTFGKIIPPAGQSYSDDIEVKIQLSNGNYTWEETVWVKLIVKSEAKPTVKLEGKWLKAGNKPGTEGLLFVECDMCDKVTVMAPGLLLNGKSQKITLTWIKPDHRVIPITLKPIPPSIQAENASEAVTVPELKVYGGEEKQALPMAKAALDIAKSGQEVGYYLAQLTEAKSVKAKIVYGALATYNVIDSVIGGLEMATPAKSAEEAAEQAAEEAAKANPYTKAIVDFLKDAAVDTIKESLENYAKLVEMQETMHPQPYKIVVKACNPFGCTTQSITIQGIGYG